MQAAARVSHPVQVAPEVIGTEDPGNLDELVFVARAVKERVAAEDLNRSAGQHRLLW